MSTNLTARIGSCKRYKIRWLSSSVSVGAPSVGRKVNFAPKSLTDDRRGESEKLQNKKPQAPIASDLDGVSIPSNTSPRSSRIVSKPIQIGEFPKNTLGRDLAQIVDEKRVGMKGTIMNTRDVSMKGRNTAGQGAANRASLGAQPQAPMQVYQTTNPGSERGFRRRPILSNDEKGTNATARAKRTNVRGYKAKKSIPEKEHVIWDDDGFAIQTPFHLIRDDPLIDASPVSPPRPLSTLLPQTYPEDLQNQAQGLPTMPHYETHFTKNDWAFVRGQDTKAHVGSVEYASLVLRRNPTVCREMKELGISTVKDFVTMKLGNTIVNTTTA